MDISLSLSIFAIFLSLIAVFFQFWLYLTLKRLIHGSKDSDFLKVIKNIENTQKNNSLSIDKLSKDLESFKELSKMNIRQVGLVKFNPFSEPGGANSFSLTLLDGNKNGIIITSLHTRERTRLYLKEIVLGKSKIELSSEENKSLNIALK